jgi:hypothetical protein
MQRVLGAGVELAGNGIRAVWRRAWWRQVIRIGRCRRRAAGGEVRVVEPLALDELKLAVDVGDEAERVFSRRGSVVSVLVVAAAARAGRASLPLGAGVPRSRRRGAWQSL